MENTPFVIQTCYNFQTEYIVIQELNVDSYLKACGEKFMINFGFKHDIDFFNQKNAVIDKDQFELIVKTYWRSASFCINLVANPKQSEMPVITPKDLQMFLIQRNCGAIIDKGKDKNTPLSEEHRKILINQSHAYLSLKCNNVQKQHLVQLSKTLVFLVPSLTDTTEGDHAGFGVTLGYLSKKFRNYKYNHKSADEQKTKKRRSNKCKRKTNETSRRSDRASITQNSNDTSNEIGPRTQLAIDDDLKFLKTVVVNEESTKTIKQKLAATADHRKDMVKISKLDFLEHFPIFFTHPEFVLFDFTVHFPEADANGFMNKWPKYGPNIKEMLKDNYNTIISAGWDDEIEEILALLKILPAKAGKKSPAVPFIKVIDKLIIHSEVSKPSQKELDENIYPRIIACGPTKKNITHYYVVVENHLVFVPPEWNIYQVFDLYFKLHMIFNISFEYNIVTTMNFIGYYFYGLKTKEFKPALRARNLHARFQFFSANEGSLV